MIKSLNSASSQVWAICIVILGLIAFALACFCKMPDVRAALLGGGTTLIGGGIGMFQHQTAQTPDPPAAKDTPPEPQASPKGATP